jgi:hypothetical protein
MFFPLYNFKNPKFQSLFKDGHPNICHPSSLPTQFSKKMFATIHDSVLPVVKSKYSSKLQILFRQQIQPWHPSSTLTHEAGVAVLQLAPDKFFDFSRALFDKQTEFFDVNVVNETRNATYKRLAKIAASSAGVEEGKVFDLLKIPDQPAEDGSLNVGNRVTNDVKVMVKMNRLVGIHVTPTVVFNVGQAQHFLPRGDLLRYVNNLNRV